MNQRRRTRVEAHKQATLSWDDAQCRGELINLSLKGCLVSAPEGPAPGRGRKVTVAIHLDPGASELDILLEGSAVRLDPSGSIAVDFTEVPADSFPHLFRLVQYNAPDPDEIEEELSSSAFQPPTPE